MSTFQEVNDASLIQLIGEALVTSDPVATLTSFIEASRAIQPGGALA